MHKRLYWLSIFCLSIAIILLGYLNVSAKEQIPFKGPVLQIKDGDTIVVNKPGTVNGDAGIFVTCRLYGIDAPEKDQPYGDMAKSYLESILANKDVTVTVMSTDIYGREVCMVNTSFSDNVNIEMIRAGYAWAYKQYLHRPYLSEYYRFEKEARDKKLGLWKDSNPTPPWEYRKTKKNKKKQAT